MKLILTSDKKNNEPKVKPSNESVSVVSNRVRNVAHAQHIQLLLTPTASNINREEDRPCHTATDKTDHNENFEKSKPEIAVQRIMLQYIRVRKRFTVRQDAKESGTRTRRSSLFKQYSLIGSGLIHPVVTTSEYQEGDKRNGCDYKGWGQSRHDTGERVGASIPITSL